MRGTPVCNISISEHKNEPMFTFYQDAVCRVNSVEAAQFHLNKFQNLVSTYIQVGLSHCTNGIWHNLKRKSLIHLCQNREPSAVMLNLKRNFIKCSSLPCQLKGPGDCTPLDCKWVSAFAESLGRNVKKREVNIILSLRKTGTVTN